MVQQTVAIIPQVDQTFGGTFSPDTPPPDRENPACEAATCRGRATPSPWSTVSRRPTAPPRAAPGRHRARWYRAGWHGAAEEPMATTGEQRAPRRRRRPGDHRSGMNTATTAPRSPEGSRPSCSCATSSSPLAVCSPWAASPLTSPGASDSPCSAPTGPARPPCSTSSPATFTPPAGRSRSTASTARPLRRVAGRDSAWPAPIRRRGCSPASPSRTTCSWHGSAVTAVIAR